MPNNLTVENIRVGNSILRNPILASYVAKGLLLYRGLGSGVPRAIESWPETDFRDDRDGNLFVVSVRREVAMTEKHPEKSRIAGRDDGENVELREKKKEKVTEKLLAILAAESDSTIHLLAGRLGVSVSTIERSIKKLQEQSSVRRVGPDKGGWWEVLR